MHHRIILTLLTSAALAACATPPAQPDPTPAAATQPEPAPTEPAQPQPDSNVKTAPAQQEDVFGGSVKLEDSTDAFAVEASSAEVKPKTGEIKTAEPAPRIPAELVIGAPLVSGPLSREDVQTRVDRQQGALRTCFAARIKEQGPAGNLIVSFNVKPAGPIEDLKVAKSSLNDPQLESCVLKALGKIVLPTRKDTAAVTVQLPLLLTAPN